MDASQAVLDQHRQEKENIETEIVSTLPVVFLGGGKYQRGEESNSCLKPLKTWSEITVEYEIY